MKRFKLIFLVLSAAFTFKNAVSQNVLMNVLTQNSGIISKGKIVFLEITICNTGSTDYVPAYKLRPQISVPSALVQIPDTGHILAPGWTIVSNAAGVIKLSNGTDMIPPHGCRTLLIAMQGISIGGPSTVSGNLLFSNGVFPGSASGGATSGDKSSDNVSTSTCEIVM